MKQKEIQRKLPPDKKNSQVFFKPEVVYLTQNIASELKTAANVKESQHKL